ncbi:CNNM domain-containing protein [Sporolactobacillus inulinus]|uniref:CNNM domain-containing protein n=1 Tax=Sporolactobacillus inulinus TaxID=2078 RepID=UPI0027D9B311|nr:CNNM domain-containing protein [Sporolactobacillus inulinus]
MHGSNLNPILGIVIVLVLVYISAFFVAAEFAIVKVRATRLDELIKQGDKRAAAAKKIVNDLNAYLSTAQLGITVTALVLGWIGEPAIAHLFHPLFQRLGFNAAITTTLSVIVGFFIVTMVSVVLGELAPKAIAIQKAEQLTLSLVYPLMWVHALFFRLSGA